jgi:PII-like signaling protein
MTTDKDSVSVTMVRASLHESSHSHRQHQIHKALGILRDQLNVHGLIISQGVVGIDRQPEGHFETLGDLLRRLPVPRMVIEFFDEPDVAHRAMQMLRETFPEARILWWSAYCAASNLKTRRAHATVV